MADKQFIKGAVTGVLCASLVLGGGYVGLQKAGRAGSTVLSDVGTRAKDGSYFSCSRTSRPV